MVSPSSSPSSSCGGEGGERVKRKVTVEKHDRAQTHLVRQQFRELRVALALGSDGSPHFLVLVLLLVLRERGGLSKLEGRVPLKNRNAHKPTCCARPLGPRYFGKLRLTMDSTPRSYAEPGVEGPGWGTVYNNSNGRSLFA
jgi:hypothetical protein